MERVRFFFDFTSPYSYLASTRVEALAARTGVEFDWRPVFLAGVLKATSNQPPATVPARGLYMARDLVRWAAFYGVPFRMTPHFPLNTLAALRAAWALKTQRPAAFPAFAHACFRAGWVDGLDLADRAVVTGLAAEADRELVATAPDAPEWKEALKSAGDEAVAAGAFGAPAFVVGKDELFFGNDRLELLEWRLTKGR
jgi:2-hydroxychromene-2-carboxylate isomerase